MFESDEPLNVPYLRHILESPPEWNPRPLRSLVGSMHVQAMAKDLPESTQNFERARQCIYIGVTRKCYFEWPMAIYGIATTAAAAPVNRRDLEAMRSCLAPLRRLRRMLLFRRTLASALLGLQRLPHSAHAEHLLVACDSELYGPGVSNEKNVAEAIASFYLSDGPSFVHKLRGAFALAIWDEKTRSLMLAVDRFGIKRLC